MEVVHFLFVQSRFVLCGRIPQSHFDNILHGFILPLIAAYGVGGEVVLEDVMRLQPRMVAFVKWVGEKDLGVGYVSLILHQLTHLVLVTNEVGGLRTNTMRYETANFLAKCFVHGSSGQEHAMLIGFIVALLLGPAETSVKV